MSSKLPPLNTRHYTKFNLIHNKLANFLMQQDGRNHKERIKIRENPFES